MRGAPIAWHHLALALLALAAAPCAAANEAAGVLAVAEPPGPGPELATLAGQLRAALRARDARVLDATTLRVRMTGPPPPASLADLDRAYAGALTTYAAGDYDQTVRTLRVVTADLEQLPEGPEVFAQWTRAMLRLARVEQVLGRVVEAQVDLERLLAAAPQVRPDPRQFPPSFLALFEESRQRVAAAPRWRVTVEAGPGFAVHVDGRDLGPSPVTVAVTPGRHRFSALRMGVRGATALVDVAADRAVLLDTSLVEVLRPDAGPGLSLPVAERGPGVVKAGARLGLDRAIAVSTLASEDGATYLVAALYDVRQGTLEREGRLRLAGGAPPPQGPEALAAFLLTGQGSGLVSTPTGPTLPPRPPVERHRQGTLLQVRGLLGQVNSSSTTASYTGLGGSLDFDLGWSLGPDLFLGGDLWLAGVFGSNRPMVVAISAELVWYLMPANVYVAAGVGIGRTVLVVNDVKVIDTNPGLHAQLTVGKEWAVSPMTGVGLAGQVTYTSSPGAGGMPTWNTWTATAGLSCTFN